MPFKRKLYLFLVYACLYLPLLAVAVYSFNSTTYASSWQHFTLSWYQALFHDSDILITAWHSLLIGLLAASSSCIMASIASVCFFRYRFFGKQFLYALIFILILMPDIVIAVSFIILYRVTKLPLGFFSLFIAHTAFCMPFATAIIYARLLHSDKTIIEAGHDLGASEWIIFRKIIMPLMLPAMVAAWLLCFTLSVDDVIISYFVTGANFSILPLAIYAKIKVGITPEINALCTLILLATLLLATVAHYLLRRKSS